MPYEKYDLYFNTNVSAGEKLPSVKIKHRPTDIYIRKANRSFYRLAYDFYDGHCEYWKIILLANPLFKNEWQMPNGFLLRIPYPIDEVLEEIEEQL